MNTSILNATTAPTRVQTIWNIAPWLSRIVVLPPIFVFTLIGVRFLTNPSHAIPGVILNGPEAFTDTRVLAAWMATLVVTLIVCLLSENRLWLGHLQLIAFMGMTLAVRVFGFIHDGTSLAVGNQRTITIVETVFLALNALGLAVQIWLARKVQVSE
ncbi:MAG TPA: hypothetical protein VJ756_09410 [Terriglobales bacterium]|nr:hypothetical protein [Terriglobales bacterium]